MLQDNTLIFAESNADVAASTILELNGSSLARDFVFMTLPAGLTAAVVTIAYGNVKASSTEITQITSEVHYATAKDLARGYMFFPTPANAYKYAQAAIDITGTPAKNFVCGITDAPDNTDVFYPAGA